MATKTISLMEDAYEVLKRAKLPDESFSDVIRREIKKSPEDFFGVWKDLDTESMKKGIKESRKKSRKRMKEVLKSFA
ncbi:MAG: antitoxin VapB family protein [Nanobdellota archaeon]